MVALYDPILAGIVRVLGPHQRVVGTGFLISLSHHTGLIATSTRVIERATSLPVNGSFHEHVQVIFHLDDSDTVWEASMKSWSGSDREDISVLIVEGTLPKRIRALPLSLATSSEGRKVSLFGYPADNRHFAGKWSCGSVSRLGPTNIQTELPFLQLDSQLVTDEYSGSPVWDDERRKVIGVVTQVINQDQEDRRLSAYAAPVELLKLVYNDIQPAKPSLHHGLAPFSKHDAASFFGYERVVDKMVHRVHDQPRFLAVTGPVGSGKTSTVHAGLLHKLEHGAVADSEGWGLFTASLSENPFQQLEAEGMEGASINLSSSIHTFCQKYHSQRLVFVLDHFENVLLQCPQERQKQFIEQLLDVIKEGTTTVILVVKNEFYSLLSTHEALMEWVEDCLVNVFAPSTKEELLTITKKRANASGASQDFRLTERILERIIDQNQTQNRSIIAIYELCQTQIELYQEQATQHDEELDTDAILHLTAVDLNEWAETIFFTLTQQQQAFAQHIFTQIVLLGDETLGIPDTGRQVQIATLCQQYEFDYEEAYKTVYDLAEKKLLVTGRDRYTGHEIVTIAQDDLIREWQRLREWLHKYREFLSWHRPFQHHVETWLKTSSEHPGSGNEESLLQGIALTEAEVWFAKLPAAFDQHAQRFLEASQQWRQQKEVSLSKEAQTEQEENERQRQLLLARELSAQAMTYYTQGPSQTSHGLQLAVEALSHAHCLEADQALRRGLLLLSRQGTCIPLTDTAVIAFNRDWHYIALASEDQGVDIIELAAGRRRFRLPHTAPITLITSDYMNEYIVTVSADRMVSVWKVSDGTRHFSYHEASCPIALKFSLDGRYLAVVNWDGATTVIKIWGVDPWYHRSTLSENEYVNTIDFNHDNTFLAIGGKEGTVRVRATTSKEELFALRLRKSVNQVIFSPGGQYLAMGNEEGVAVLHMETFESLLNELHAAHVHSLLFDPEGLFLAAGSSDGMVRVWEIPSGRRLAQLRHSASVSALAFSFDSSYLATASEDTIVRIWDTETYQEVAQLLHEQPIQRVIFSMNKRHLFTLSDDHIVRVWEVIKSRQCTTFASPAPASALLCSATDGTLSITARCTDTMLRQWQMDLNTEQHTFSSMHLGPTSLITSSSDGAYLAVATGDGTITIWNIAQAKEVVNFSCKRTLVRISFCRDINHLAVMSSDGTIDIWKWEAKSVQTTMKLDVNYSFRDIILSFDERYLGTISADGIAHLWEWKISGATLLFELPDAMQELGFSPDGCTLLTKNSDHEAFLWNLPYGPFLFPLIHNGEIFAITFSPDSRYIATGSADQTVKLWEIATGRLISELVHKAGVNTIAFSPDGMYLATGCRNSVVSAWLWRTEDLIYEAFWKGKGDE